MYKYASGQIRFEDFGQPVGMHMSPDNRWVKRAESIPWDEIEHRYAELFKNRKGNVANRFVWLLEPASFNRNTGFRTKKQLCRFRRTRTYNFSAAFRNTNTNSLLTLR